MENRKNGGTSSWALQMSGRMKITISYNFKYSIMIEPKSKGIPGIATVENLKTDWNAT